jgi:L-amino acid N-acyltransferase YncA
MIISAMTLADWPAVARIYQEGIDTGNATFATVPPASWEDWRKGKINSCSLVVREDGEIVGWAALSPVSSRKVYAGVAEVSIYVGAKTRGRGVGAFLLEKVIRRAEKNGLWTLQGGIFPENQTSLRMFYKQGFREVGIREKMGKMEFGEHEGKWRDVVLVERRSKIAGI